MKQPLTTDTERRVSEANARFYAAMSALDIQEMTEVWLCTPDAVCVHPGREAIVGYARVLESWQQIFSSTGSMSIDAGDETVVVCGDAAWVSCVETISATLADEGLALTAAAQATNVFRRGTDGRWRMTLHHASPLPLLRAEEDWPDVID